MVDTFTVFTTSPTSSRVGHSQTERGARRLPGLAALTHCRSHEAHHPVMHILQAAPSPQQGELGQYGNTRGANIARHTKRVGEAQSGERPASTQFKILTIS